MLYFEMYIGMVDLGVRVGRMEKRRVMGIKGGEGKNGTSYESPCRSYEDECTRLFRASWFFFFGREMKC